MESDRVIRRPPDQHHRLLPALHEVQDREGWISPEATKELSARLGIPAAEIHGVASFYHSLATEPGPERRRLVCDDVACLAAGIGDLPADLVRSSCLGRCEHAASGPVITDLSPPSVEVPPAGEFRALDRARKLGADGVLAELAASGLVGRGGAAFPTARKWEAVARAPATPHYVVCNADESEPGTFKDRWLIERDPYRVLEGMLVCALAVGAERAFVYIRDEYPVARRLLELAVPHLPGEVAIEVRRGAGAYICGEETALLNSIEGRRGEPRNRPPFPVERGLFGKPTVVNNVETLVAVCNVLEQGPPAARRKLFSVSGAVERAGVYEVELGTSLSALLGEAGARSVRAVLVGGAAGRFLGPDELDLPLSFDSGLGSGSIIVFDRTVDFDEVLLRIARFFREESCGQCVPCRVGTVRQEEALRRLLSNQPLGGQGAEVERLRELAQVMRDASICGLGQTASTAVQSGLGL